MLDQVIHPIWYIFIRKKKRRKKNVQPQTGY